jgi:uncharacterized membrane protein
VADATTARIDAFTDAAFAFAVTLLVVGAGGAQVDRDMLGQTVASIPSFAIGFAIIAMFWVAHVRWRDLRGPGDWRSLMLTLLLVFVTLIYVVPLRGMATSFANYVRGSETGAAPDVAMLFVVYGIGFVAMAAITALLYRDALRRPDLSLPGQRSALGQVWIWSILAWTGLVSTILALFPATWAVAPWVYATLPASIGLFASRWDWTGSVADRGGGTGDAARQPVLTPDDIEA